MTILLNFWESLLSMPLHHKIATVFGALGIALSFFAYIQKKRSAILFIKLITDFFWIINYALFGQFSGATTNFIAMVREGVFMQRGKRKWAESQLWLFLFIGLMLLSPLTEILSAGFSFIALLPAVGSVLSAIGFFQKDTLKVKTLVALCQVIYIFYNTMGTFNLTATIGATVPLISCIIGIIAELRMRAYLKQKAGKSS